MIKSWPTALVGVAGLALVIAAYAWGICGSPDFGYLADQRHQLHYMREYNAALLDGEFPPRWAAGANGGRGSPDFIFYSPLFSAVGAACRRFAADDVTALAASVFLAVIFNFFAVAYAARARLSWQRSFLAGAVTLLLPGVTFITQARGMYANFFALGWLALVLGAADRLLNREQKAPHAITLAIAAIGLVLSHSLSAFLLAVLAAVLLPVILKRWGFKSLAPAALAALIALAATVWFWLPMLYNGRHIQNQILVENHPYSASSFFYQPETSAAKTGVPEFEQDWGEINQVGQWATAAQLALAVAVWLGVRRETPPSLIQLSLPWVLLTITLASIAPVAAILEKLPYFPMIQFMWRWQLPLALWCGLALASLPMRKRSLPAALLGLGLILFFSPLLWPAKQAAIIPDNLPETMQAGEYDKAPELARRAYIGNLLAMRPLGVPRDVHLPAPFGRVEVVEGEATVEPIDLKTSRREYRVSAKTPAVLRLITYDFPGWQARLDGRSTPIEKDLDSGLQLIPIPPGDHRLVHRFETPLPWP